MTENVIFGFTLTVLGFYLGKHVNKIHNNPLTNPMVFSIFFVIIFLLIFDIPYDEYFKGGSYLTFFLPFASLSLVLPFYRNFDVFIRYKVPIIAGSFAGALTSIISVYILGSFFNFSDVVMVSTLPKSVTTAIALPLSLQAAGNVSLTATAIAITGTTGVIVNKPVFKLLNINNDVAMGAALGTASHASGTTVALEKSEKSAAISSICLVLTALMSSVLYPLFVSLVLD